MNLYQKYVDLYQKIQFFRSNWTIFHYIRQIFDIIILFGYKFEVRFEFGPRFRIVAMISTLFRTEFGFENVDLCRFEYNLYRSFGRPRSNRISLRWAHDLKIVDSNPGQAENFVHWSELFRTYEIYLWVNIVLVYVYMS